MLMRLANWSWLIFQVTFGNCFVNSSDSLNGMSKPVSNVAFRTTGSVPQLGTGRGAGGRAGARRWRSRDGGCGSRTQPRSGPTMPSSPGAQALTDDRQDREARRR